MSRAGTVTIIRGGRLLDPRAHRADPADILVTGDTIAEVGAPGLAAPPDAAVDARGPLLHAGLINAHTHAHGNLAKGMGDRWTLELLLTAGAWISGGRTLEDRYLSAKLGAVGDGARRAARPATTCRWSFPRRRPRAPRLSGARTRTSGCAPSWRRWSPTARSTRRFPA